MELPPTQHHHHHHTKPPEAAVEDTSIDVSTELQRKIANNNNTCSVDMKVVVGVVGNKEDPDETDYSSSFADTTTTCSRNNDSSAAAISDDDEVESHPFLGEENDVFSSTSDEFNTIFPPMRKKRLTNHWRKFIDPLMWRCKWAELKIKQFESQALKYSRDAKVNNRNKQLALDQFPCDDFGSRSLPYTSQSHRRKAMKRRKRKRIEETTDTESYMRHHNLFSYFENKKTDLDGADEFGSTENTEENIFSNEESNKNNWPFIEDKDDVMVPVLSKIDRVHKRVQNLKAKLEVVLSKNAAKFSSSENLSLLVPCEMQTSCVPSPTFSACNGETKPVYAPTKHILSEYDMGDFMMPESAVSSHGEAIPIPDIIESTVGLHTSTVVTHYHSQIGDSNENIVDNNIVNNQTTEAEGHTFSRQKRYDEETKEHDDDEEKSGGESNNNNNLNNNNNNPAKAQESEDTGNKPVVVVESEFPKKHWKRKRGERKPRTSGWTKQYPAEEPDNQ